MQPDQMNIYTCEMCLFCVGTRHRHMLGHRYSYYVYSQIAKPLTKASGCITPTLTGGDEKRDEDEDEEE